MEEISSEFKTWLDLSGVNNVIMGDYFEFFFTLIDPNCNDFSSEIPRKEEVKSEQKISPEKLEEKLNQTLKVLQDPFKYQLGWALNVIYSFNLDYIPYEFDEYLSQVKSRNLSYNFTPTFQVNEGFGRFIIKSHISEEDSFACEFDHIFTFWRDIK